MKNKTKYKWIIVSVLCLIILIIKCSNNCDNIAGQDGISLNIKESKERNVFICEYTSPQNPYLINDSLIIHVKSAWLERTWKFTSSCDETVITKRYQLIVITNPKDIIDMTLKWRIGLDSDRNFYGCGNECMVSKFKELPKAEIEIWKVQQGDHLYKGAEHKIIGEFRLIKK